MEENKDELNDSILTLQNKLNALKFQVENYLEKEKLYQSSLLKIKQIQNEYENSYSTTLNNYKNKENMYKKEFQDLKNL